MIPFVTTYNPKHVNIFQQSIINISIVERIKHFGLQQGQSPNLKTFLTKTKFNSKSEKSQNAEIQGVNLF